MNPTTDTLDEMLTALPKYCEDYVFVMNTDILKEIGDNYKGRIIRRYKLIEEGKCYLMPDPNFKPEEL